MIGKNLKQLHEYLGYDSHENLQNRRAKLFPIGNRKVEDEPTTCSIFLATLVGIQEFRENLLATLNLPEANKICNQTAELHAFVEVAPRDVFPNTKDRPDGLLILTTGKTDKTIVWGSWIEAKTITDLTRDQLQNYLDLKKYGIQNVISISNDFTTQPQINPTGIINKHLFHWSWRSIRSLLKQTRNRGISDMAQQYIASELIRYLEGHKGISAFVDMGKNWKEAAEHIADVTTRKNHKSQASEIAAAWIQEEKDIAMELSENELGKLGFFPVDLVLSRQERKKDTARFQNHIDDLIKKSKLSTSYDISHPTTNKPQCRFDLTINFPNNNIELAVDIPASQDGKAKRQVTQLLGMLVNAGLEDLVKLQAHYGNRRYSEEESLAVLRKQNQSPTEKSYKIVDKSLGAEIKSFRISYTPHFAKVAFNHPKKFIRTIEDETKAFYEQIIACFLKK